MSPRRWNQLLLRVGIGQVHHDRRRLGEHEVTLDQHGHVRARVKIAAVAAGRAAAAVSGHPAVGDRLATGRTGREYPAVVVEQPLPIE